MKKIICKVCNSSDVINQGSYYECQECGSIYSLEEVQEMTGGHNARKTQNSLDDQFLNDDSQEEKTGSVTGKSWVIIAVAVVAVVALILALLFGMKGKKAQDPCADGHKWLPAGCTTPQVCENCGLMQGNAQGHSWLNATCTTPQYCERCGQTQGVTAEHQWNQATYEKPMTCNTCGATQGEPLKQEAEQPKQEAEQPKQEVVPPMRKEDVHDYVMSVRQTFSRIYTDMTQGYLTAQKRGSGTKLFYDRGDVLKGITVYHGIDGIGIHSAVYSRTYVFDEGKLIMAVYDGGSSLNHRFYFYDEQLVHWKYTHESGEVEEFTMDYTDDYKNWESVVLGEVNSLLGR